ncbi:uridine kinase family protein [Kribbella sp. CA-294648]|uniref:uridine kinase family protein n=1 Tax=Kribbella sp. CA-294648 TaxID=3239948 RepID=UPI003D905F5A
MMRPGPGEQAVDSWRAVALADLAGVVRECAGEVPSGRPCIVAVDGRSGGGKSTLARRLADVVPESAVVHVDDVAWNAPMFGWAELLADGVLEPLRRGEAVSYRPPAWEDHDRSGAIVVPSGRSMVVVEGVGAGRRELSDLIDCLIWVQSDYSEAERRGLARDLASGVNGDTEATIAFWHTWMAAENPFLSADRPWARADLITAGSSPQAQPPNTVLIAPRSAGSA